MLKRCSASPSLSVGLSLGSSAAGTEGSCVRHVDRCAKGDQFPRRHSPNSKALGGGWEQPGEVPPPGGVVRAGPRSRGGACRAERTPTPLTISPSPASTSPSHPATPPASSKSPRLGLPGLAAQRLPRAQTHWCGGQFPDALKPPGEGDLHHPGRSPRDDPRHRGAVSFPGLSPTSWAVRLEH